MARKTILIDSDIIISAIVYDGVCRKILIELLNRHYGIFVSQYIDHEIRNKILQKWNRESKKILILYETIAIPVLESSGRIIEKVCDPKDAPIVNDAIYNNKDILFTGDKDFENVKCDIEIMGINDMLKFLNI